MRKNAFSTQSLQPRRVATEFCERGLGDEPGAYSVMESAKGLVTLFPDFAGADDDVAAEFGVGFLFGALMNDRFQNAQHSWSVNIP
jgi:hypothetical protein